METLMLEYPLAFSQETAKPWKDSSSVYNRKYLTVPQNRTCMHSNRINGAFEAPRHMESFSSSIINNYLDGMHFRDSKRKVDYVLAYHYRRRFAQHPPGAGLPDPTCGSASLAVVTNGVTGKVHAKLQQQGDGQHDLQEQPRSPGVEVIELSPLDALEEEKRLQREEYEHSLVEAGLEIEKDPEAPFKLLKSLQYGSPQSLFYSRLDKPNYCSLAKEKSAMM